MAGLADLRRDTPCPAGTPTGAGATASPLRGFGHLLAVIACRNPAPSRDAAADSIWVCCFPKNCLAVKGRSQGPARRPQLDRRERPGEDWGEAEPLTPNRNETCFVVGVGCFTPPCHVASAPGGPAGGGFGVAFASLFLPKEETYKCAFPIKHREVNPGSDLGVS